MNHHQLYKTIENIASQKFASVEDLLKHVIDEIIASDKFVFTGGRAWKLIPEKQAYKIIYQTGNIERIADNYTVKIKDNPVFLEVAKYKTLLAEETNKYLRKKGISKYSLAGVGNKTKSDNFVLYDYLLAFNHDEKQGLMALHQLSIIGSAVTSALRRNKAKEKTKQLEQDLSKAQEIQRSILPEHDFKFGDYEIYGLSLPELIVGGDFFDYITSPGETERLSIVIGDAASKGISAAIQALYVSGAIRMGMTFQIQITSLLYRINNLVNKTFPYDRFVTLFFAEFMNNSNGLCIFSNAGHNSPIFYKSAENITEQLPITGTAIGISPNQKYEVENINMKKDDILVLFTDGISEAMNSQFEQYTEERLAKLIITLKDLNPKEICVRIIEDVMSFSKNSEYSDDKTIVVIKKIN
jgi:sigma-B regulation protein RsbU (phosphoserine phosphatase)